MHYYCGEIKAGSDVTQTDSALAFRHRFGKANICALHERFQVRREAHRRRSGAGNRRRSRLLPVACIALLGVSCATTFFPLGKTGHHGLLAAL